ncbi:hypothetical protein SAMN06297144_2694 [Sphingomonas guangdongensis]|uniref:DUF3618 domain-containing protein n=1 Tax=Sphingomonas guangdongensis TaxID=1141890 RepID=A0A285R5D0_9SPHN|nr:hypothetical protein [Sphingomonas guangdongensis]SOB87562.1 hypothetical protein SAMN06297144_2694 [Sphingomonas guangdongensis]
MTDPALLAARARRDAAKLRLDRSIEHARQRLNPKTIAEDAVMGVRTRAEAIATDGVDAVKSRPGVAAAALGLAGLLLVRRPLLRWFGRREPAAETPASPDR